MSEKMYVYTWTAEEGRALLKRILEYQKKERERKRRWRAKKKAERVGTARRRGARRDDTGNA